jgi:hypothetical protein
MCCLQLKIEQFACFLYTAYCTLHMNIRCLVHYTTVHMLLTTLNTKHILYINTNAGWYTAHCTEKVNMLLERCRRNWIYFSRTSCTDTVPYSKQHIQRFVVQTNQYPPSCQPAENLNFLESSDFLITRSKVLFC